MLSIFSFITRPLKKTLLSVEDSVQQGLITIFYYVVLFNYVKIAVIFPFAILENDFRKVIFCCLAVVITVVLLKTLLAKPEYLKKLIHLALSSSLFFLFTKTFYLNSHLTLLTIQTIFMICIWSFYALKSKWAFFYSILATVPLFYVLIIKQTVAMPLGMAEVTFFVLMTTINFGITFIAHHYYSNLLYEALRTKKKLFDELGEVYKKQSLFFSSMSHELRTPLNAVIGMTHLLVEGNENKTQKENLNILKFSAENLLVLINDLLDLNKIDSGKVEIEAISFNLFELINNACAGLRIQAKNKGLNFISFIDPILDKNLVIGDPTRIVQIIFNLLSNAIKFTKQGEVAITVTVLKKVNEMAVIGFSIKDTGLGLSKDQQQVVFDPFAQASLQTSRKFGGTGLGLSIVKQLLALHHSTIQVKSELNAGAEFYFNITFPLAKNTSKIPKIPVIQPAIQVTQLRVLLAEDDMMSSLFMKKLFSRWGITLDVAVNGLEVISMLEIKDYDVILMDIQMPEMNGYEATINIRAMENPVKAKVYIIALTASVSGDVSERILEAGMNDVLSKPFNPDWLHRKLQHIPKKHAAIRENASLLNISNTA
ncbi:ATP-binding protein [Pedobacter sp.]|uniref:ATP-binding protein n=1 Tax=Pedobacter sp. TaxID=1411316 RepID=UPI003D7FA4F6